jgi:hypothetical protein
MAPQDDGLAVHYLSLKRGTPIYGSDDVVVGTVVEVLEIAREHFLDGIVFETPDGERRFVDAPEVARTAERAVTLTITAEEAARLGPPAAPGPRLGGTLKGLFGGLRRR